MAAEPHLATGPGVRMATGTILGRPVWRYGHVGLTSSSAVLRSSGPETSIKPGVSGLSVGSDSHIHHPRGPCLRSVCLRHGTQLKVRLKWLF